ncbi:NAD(P)/FAD-dependent oxidoreductase [Shimia thalassica]|uniref:NAD(P)/FAD-dependent oxidoreductase n=1 Tax=Shimia thalassica TaxID=1715693 RepID=UPI0026E36429|nr:FAD-binding oxidoreductase [Shimia thalassica]MDO6797351.1 FAD-binding oxidoreductase [Shimia thalassica]
MSVFPISLTNPIEHNAPLPEQADAVIIGGGIIGIASAYYLAKKGLKPVVLEKGRVAGEQSSRNWGWIRQMGRDLDELPIVMESTQLWKEMAKDLDTDIGLTQCGLTYFAQNQTQTEGYEDWLSKAREIGVDSVMLSAKEVDAKFPGMTRQYTGALHTPSDMRAEPWVTVPAIARAAVKMGAVIVEDCAARVLETSGGKVSGVVTEKGTIQTSEVIVAGGSWSTVFLRNEGINIPQLSVRATVVATHALPDVHQGGANGSDFAFRRRQDGGYTLAASGFHETFVGPDSFRHFMTYLPQLINQPFSRNYLPMSPKGYPDGWGTRRRWKGSDVSPFENMRMLDPKPNMRKVEEIRSTFQGLFPALGPVEVSTAWAGMIDAMPDIVPVVDRAPIQGLSICTGMCGHGFGIGPAFGRIMADMVTGDDIGHDLSRFRLSRFSDGSKLVMGPDL